MDGGLENSNFQQKEAQTLRNSLTKVIVFSLIFGLIGGAFGAWGFLVSPLGKKMFKNSAVPVLSQPLTLTEDSAIIDVVKKAGPAVVSIVISKDLSKLPNYNFSPFDQDPFFQFFGNTSGQSSPQAPNIQEVGAGSGFFVSADGLILTNKHVVSDEQASYTVITQDGRKFDAKVVAQDPAGDFAIVKINTSNAPFLKLGDSSKVQIGQRVIAIGNSLGLYQNTVTSGIISGKGRSIMAGGLEGSEELSGVIQTDAAINPGNSGGPLLNIFGEVVGINTAIDQQGQLVGFAIPSNDAAKGLALYIKKGKITRSFLGVRYQIITPEMAKQKSLPVDYGAVIVRGQTATDFAVLPGSPADKAGLVENDIILEVNGQKIDKDHQLADVLKDYNSGDNVKMRVYHKGGEKQVTVVLGEK